MRIKLRIIAFLVLIAMAVCIAPALAVQADTVTKQCTFEVTRGKAKYLTDSDYETVWSPSGSNEKLLITLPPMGAGYIVIEWQDEPVSYMLEEYDVEKNKIASSDQNAHGGGVIQLVPVSDNTRYVLLTLAAKGQGICEISVYSRGDMPDSIQKWYGEYTKCDMLLVAAYPGDELITFGGLLPYYSIVRDAKVQPVYMTDMDRERKAETLDALWDLGLDNYPVFMDLKKGSVDSLEDCLRNWGGKDALIGRMVEVIRRCKPEVVVSHDINGEGGDYRRALTGMLMEYAVKAAADPEAYADSAASYGTWQAKKLYLHLGTANQVNVMLETPSDLLGGLTANEAAVHAFANYDSLKGSYSAANNGDVYSLIYSTIGEDTDRNDLFENVPGLDISGDEAGTTPEPTVRPTMEPVLVFSPEPTVTARPALGEVEGFSSSAKQVAKFVGISLGAILLITCLQAVSFHMRGRKRRKWY